VRDIADRSGAEEPVARVTGRDGYHAAMASPSRRAVLDVLLASADPLDAAAVSERVGLHLTTTRFHLDHLVDAGLARRRPSVEGRRGRPRMLYAPAGAPRDRDAREQLIRVLSGALADHDDEESRRAGRRWATAFDPPHPDDPVPGLVDVLERLGFDPEPDGAVDPVIRLPSCPFREAARDHPDVVCAAHRGLIEGLMDGTARDARLLPFVEPQLCLVTVGPTAG
jgi:predicted ArsR family transcriptional regulator